MDFNDLKDKAQDALKDVNMDDLKDKAQDLYKDNKDAVEGAADKVKGFFDKK